MARSLEMALGLGGLVAAVMSPFLLVMWALGWRERRGRTRVIGAVVSHEQRYDESYRRLEYFPVVQYEVAGEPWRVKLAVGCFQPHHPRLSPGRTYELYVAPESPGDAVPLRFPGVALLLAPACGLLTAAFVFALLWGLS